MSVRVALQAIGLLVVGYFLLGSLLAMGPIGWLVFVPMLLVGAAEVYRRRARRDRGSDGGDDYCANCGSAIELDAFDTRETEESDSEWETGYCANCGAPVGSGETADRTGGSTGSERPMNCPDCGAPNDPDRTTCNHCDATL